MMYVACHFVCKAKDIFPFIYSIPLISLLIYCFNLSIQFYDFCVQSRNGLQDLGILVLLGIVSRYEKLDESNYSTSNQCNDDSH